MSQGILFVLSAPSGTGKTTILKRVMTDICGLSFSVSHTTRGPRQGEVNGTDYHFVDRRTFLQMKKQDHFLECADVHGNLYGTSKLSVLEQIQLGIDVILDIDVQGARIVKESGGAEAVYIFLAPPGLAELERRLRVRGQDSDGSISTRLANAQEEMAAVGEFDYLIVNENLDEAVRTFEAIIVAERARHRRRIDGKSVAPGIQDFEETL